MITCIWAQPAYRGQEEPYQRINQVCGVVNFSNQIMKMLSTPIVILIDKHTSPNLKQLFQALPSPIDFWGIWPRGRWSEQVWGLCCCGLRCGGGSIRGGRDAYYIGDGERMPRMEAVTCWGDCWGQIRWDTQKHGRQAVPVHRVWWFWYVRVGHRNRIESSWITFGW